MGATQRHNHILTSNSFTHHHLYRHGQGVGGAAEAFPGGEAHLTRQSESQRTDEARQVSRGQAHFGESRHYPCTAVTPPAPRAACNPVTLTLALRVTLWP